MSVSESCSVVRQWEKQEAGGRGGGNVITARMRRVFQKTSLYVDSATSARRSAYQ